MVDHWGQSSCFITPSSKSTTPLSNFKFRQRRTRNFDTGVLEISTPASSKFRVRRCRNLKFEHAVVDFEHAVVNFDNGVLDFEDSVMKHELWPQWPTIYGRFLRLLTRLWSPLWICIGSLFQLSPSRVCNRGRSGLSSSVDLVMLEKPGTASSRWCFSYMGDSSVAYVPCRAIYI